MSSNHKALEKPLKKLKAVADSFHTTNPMNPSLWRVVFSNCEFTARDLVQLCIEYSAAAEGNAQKAVSRLVRRYRQDEFFILGMDADDLEGALQGYMFLLDELFFFGLLTRRVKRRGLLQPPEPLVELKVQAGYDKDIQAKWSKKDSRITIFQEKPLNSHLWFNEPSLYLDELLSNLVHEMVHAYLGIFSDTFHKDHKEDVQAEKGHGKMFWVLYCSIMKTLDYWVPDTEWFGRAANEAEEAARNCR